MMIETSEFPLATGLALDTFVAMDDVAVNDYHLPIELMMENAGLCLARLTALQMPRPAKVVIGIGIGNNGGGGLVAARRLAAWGYRVSLDIPVPLTKALPKKQLQRALAFGVNQTADQNPDIWLDAYFGFAQRPPLPAVFLERLISANKSAAKRLSLDLPSGFLGDLSATYFAADSVLTLAAPKYILSQLPENVLVYMADIGLPEELYRRYRLPLFPFDKHGIVKMRRR
jgi:NAD(P)H-hydrate epimerase